MFVCLFVCLVFFVGVRIVQILVICVVFYRSLLVFFVPFLLAITVSVLRFMASDYRFAIFKPFLVFFYPFFWPLYSLSVLL